MESNDQINSPALLTTYPPVGISTRPTAVVASTGPTRSMSAFVSSTSSIKTVNDTNPNTRLNSAYQQAITSSTSAFQPIASLQNLLNGKSTNKSAPLLMDIPQHKALARSQQLTKVHISHPQSPSIVYVSFNPIFTKIFHWNFLVDVTRRFQYGLPSSSWNGGASWPSTRSITNLFVQVWDINYFLSNTHPLSG